MAEEKTEATEAQNSQGDHGAAQCRQRSGGDEEPRLGNLMTVHVRKETNYMAGKMVSGDAYIVPIINGAGFEFTTAAESYGSGFGIKLSRVMWDQAPVEMAKMTSAGSVQIGLAAGYIQIDIAEDVIGAEIVFGGNSK